MHCTRPPSHCRRACTSSRVLLFLLRVQPLLELVQDDQHLLARRDALAPAQGRQRFRCRSPGFAWQVPAAPLPQAVQQPGFRLLGRRLDIDRNHVVGQPRQQPALTSDDLPQPEGP